MVDSLRVDMHGTVQTFAALDAWRRRSEGAYAGAIYMFATNVISTSLKLAPADTGYLRASRYVRRPVVDASGRFDVEVGYGAPYAIHVHEINKRYVVGEWKYLAKAIDWHAPTAAREIAGWTAKLALEGKTIDDVPETHPQIWTGGERRAPRRNARQRAQRMADRLDNEARMRRESRASLDAQRAGRRAPRPGRG